MPGDNESRVVVDDGLDEELSLIGKDEIGDVEVPNFVWTLSPNSDFFGNFGVDFSRSFPFVLMDVLLPRRIRAEKKVFSLGVVMKRANWKVGIFL